MGRLKNIKPVIFWLAVSLGLLLILMPDESYEECVLEHIKDAATPYAALKIDEACAALHPQKQKAKLDYSTLLHDK